MHTLFVAAVATVVGAASLGAQQLTMTRANGDLLPLGGGHVAVLDGDSSGVKVTGVVAGSSTAVPDVKQGDRVVAIQGRRASSLDSLMSSFRAIALGDLVELELERAGKAIVVRFPRVAVEGRGLAVQGGAGGAGAWVTASDSQRRGFSIAGVHFRENAQGMPEVSHRESHPASASIALRAGDMITAVNGRSIAALAGLEMVYARTSVGERVTLRVKRGHETLELSFSKPDGR
jgi:S1-C subfamily serine protease